MEARRPITVVVSRFEDLVSRGLRALIGEDSNIEIVGFDVPHGQLARSFAAQDPDVGILNFGSLRTPIEVRDLHSAHPDTRIVVLANRPTPAECNQMLAFGATACLSKETEARDILNAIHLASRGLHVLPKTPREFGAIEPTGPEVLTPARPTCSSCSSTGARTPRSRWPWAWAWRPSAPTRATSTASSA